MTSAPCRADIDEIAEAYLKGRLTPEEAIAFEDHYITCRACAEQLQEIEEFRSALRAAANNDGSKPLVKSAQTGTEAVSHQLEARPGKGRKTA